MDSKTDNDVSAFLVPLRTPPAAATITCICAYTRVRMRTGMLEHAPVSVWADGRGEGIQSPIRLERQPCRVLEGSIPHTAPWSTRLLFLSRPCYPDPSCRGLAAAR